MAGSGGVQGGSLHIQSCLGFLICLKGSRGPRRREPAWGGGFKVQVPRFMASAKATPGSPASPWDSAGY